MSWGIFLADILIKGTFAAVGGAVKAGQTASAKWQIQQQLSQQQKENTAKRQLCIDSRLLATSGNLPHLTGQSRLLLGGESTVVSAPLLLPNHSNNANAFQSTVISGGTNSVRSRALAKMCENASSNGQSVIVVHYADKELESLINNSTVIRDKLISIHIMRCLTLFLV
jgi:hypothetical protein